ncbi:hypothetical protein BJ170DRAFT_696539 [Xylariales sp. AK1849]|nr:hypothetical protein BJ170DRAFT_696539 [Xylariales sp. AK1849]
MVYPTNCCSALVAVLASKISFPGSQQYNESLTSYYSAQEAALFPSCIVSPISAADVSKSVATLTRSNCSFAIRSGGHSTWAGDANIANGVTIDLQGLNTVHVSDDGCIASVGPGARWGQVYKEVVNHNRIVAGGRVGTVGVGGLTLGGGISSFGPRFGWTCDSVVNFEIVLAHGAVINANETHHADLLHALRGGSNNFGVVTRIDFQTHEQGDIWGGVVHYSFDTVPQQLIATSDLASADPYDEYANLVMGFAYVAGGGQSVSSTLHYTKPVEYPDFFKPFTDIPHGDDTLRIANYSNFADEGAANNPDGYRALLSTTSIGSSLQMLTAAFDAWNKSVAAFAGTVNLQSELLFEPIPQNAYHAAALGTNVLGLDSNKGGLVIVGVAVGWADESNDALATQVAQEIIADINAQAKKLDEHFDLIYLNYAMDWQNVIPSYGTENVAKLKHVSRKYDPKGVFQKNVPGGFKLF